MMSPEDREQVRLSLLRYLAANPTRYGLPLRYLRQALATEGRRLTPAEVEAEVIYLQDKKLVEETVKVLSPENMAWRITASGRDHLALVQGD